MSPRVVEVAVLVALGMAACGETDQRTDAKGGTSSGGAASGGAQGAGGASGGGVQSTGSTSTGGFQGTGSTASGGSSSETGGGTTSGGTSTGGSTTGGMANAGGTVATGGGQATGGTATGGFSTGGTASGGVSETGGASGGIPSTGGSATGGVAATGGAGTGGFPSTGGAPATGGSGPGGAGGAGGTDGAGGAGTGGIGETGGTSAGCGVPTSFSWSSSAALITPPSGSVSIKDPTVLYHDGKWHIYATHYSDSYSMVYLNFTDWDQAGAAAKTPVASNPNLSGYKCAPQLFYFSPQNLWYLIYQTQEPAYSTTTDPTDVSSWSPSTRFMNMPSIITNSDTGGIDYWVICDDTDCYLFFSADNGVLYRARTAKADFPDGFEGTTEIVMQESKNALFEASNVYKMAGTDQYLLIHEAIGNGRYFRSWTADRLDGDWTPLKDTQADPFASTSNVTGADWSNDGISHGEMLRENADETMTIDTCNMRYLFQGRTQAGSTYNLHQYSLGLLTSTQ